MNSLMGYKISDSHFKLGSKTHIKDFIYAKRLFQNSFFAHRFSFIVAKYLRDYFKAHPLNENDSLTLLGYGEYSQMLLNRVEKMLQPTIRNINYDMVRDVEQPEFIKGEKLNDYIIIIVPISTTFSTSIKVENMIQNMVNDKKCNSVVLEPYINLILVSHKDINDVKYVDQLNSYLNSTNAPINDDFEPYRLFNWTSIDLETRTITIKTNPPVSFERKQKYFISIPSEWYLMDTCEFCIPPDNLLREKPLLETDKASVTPDLLLELPQSFKNNTLSANKEIVLNEEALFSGHIDYLGHHYRYLIQPIQFFKKYESEITIWAQARKKELSKWANLFQSKILLISPNQQSNTYFVELINRYVFEDSATIIHYEVKGDFVENYHKFFGEVVNSSDYIFFIDDFIQSGSTFHLINDFVILCRKLNPNSVSSNGCSGVFTLINKTDNFSYTDILAHLSTKEPEISDEEKFFAFYDLKIHAINKENCPLCIEQRRYKQLSESSMLDTIRHYFLGKQIKLNAKKITEIEKDNSGGYIYHPLVNENTNLPWNSEKEIEKEKWEMYKTNIFPNKNYIKFLIEHELNNILSTDIQIRERLNTDISNIDEQEDYLVNEELYDDIKARVYKSTSINYHFAKINPACHKILERVCGECIIKVFTLHPFSNIKAIRQKVFSWVLIELEKTVKKILDAEALIFRDFRYLKFLLKRATILGSNYLIRKETLANLKLIYQKYTLTKKEEFEIKRAERIYFFDQELISLTIDLSKKTDELFSIEEKLAKLESEVKIRKLNSLGSILFETENNLSNLRLEKVEIIAKKTEVEYKVEYIKQALNNISYKEASLSEFSYFYVALIKELTLNNDSKVLILEENIKQIISSIDSVNEVDFYFLVRLIQFENISLINQGLNIIVNDYLLQLKNEENSNESLICFKRKSGEEAIENKMKGALRKAFDDYRLIPFKKFLGITDFETWTQTNDIKIFMHVLYLIVSFQNEEINPCNMPLENKTKAIVRNMFRIAGYPDFSNDTFKIDNKTEKNIRHYALDQPEIGGFIAIRYKGDKNDIIKTDEIIIAQETKDSNKIPGPSLIDVEIDNESLAYFVLNGISKRQLSSTSITSNNILQEYPLKPWTIFEIQLDTSPTGVKYWKSLRGKVFPVNSKLNKNYDSMIYSDDINDGFIYGFTENLNIEDDPKQMLFFRIADIFEEKGKIKNLGQAIICIYNTGVAFDIHRIRLLLLLRPYLMTFIKSHFDNDSLIAFISERTKLKEADRLKHGYPVYLSNFSNLAKDINFNKCNRNDLINLYYNLISSGPILPKILSKYEETRNTNKVEAANILKTLDEMYKLKDFSEQDILSLIKNLIEIIYSTDIYDTGEVDIQNDLVYGLNESSSSEKNIRFYEGLLIIMIAEALINAKNAQKIFANSYKVNVSLNFDSTDNYYYLNIANNIDNKAALNDKKLLRLKKNNQRFNTHGLGLIKRISHVFFDKFAEVDFKYNSYFNSLGFEISIPIKSINENEKENSVH